LTADRAVVLARAPVCARCSCIITVREAALATQLGFLQNAMGAVLSPQDAWLVLRGSRR
jgi:cystathionine beta-lyase/cystathionine gamma-synthase